MTWAIEFSDDSRKWLRKANPQASQQVLRFIRDRIAPLANPRDLGEALTGPRLGNYWKYRTGDYRIIAEIQDRTVRILIVDIGNRREIYRR